MKGNEPIWSNQLNNAVLNSKYQNKQAELMLPPSGLVSLSQTVVTVLK